jgi:hypothetical protein
VDVPGGRREDPRSNIRLAVALQAVHCSHPATLFDVSRTGAKMSMPEQMYRGQQVWLTTNNLRLFGFVCWIRGSVCGIRFDEPLRDWQFSQLKVEGQSLITPGRSLDERFAAAEWQSNLIR